MVHLTRTRAHSGEAGDAVRAPPAFNEGLPGRACQDGPVGAPDDHGGDPTSPGQSKRIRTRSPEAGDAALPPEIRALLDSPIPELQPLDFECEDWLHDFAQCIKGGERTVSHPKTPIGNELNSASPATPTRSDTGTASQCNSSACRKLFPVVSPPLAVLSPPMVPLYIPSLKEALVELLKYLNDPKSMEEAGVLLKQICSVVDVPEDEMQMGIVKFAASLLSSQDVKEFRSMCQEALTGKMVVLSILPSHTRTVGCNSDTISYKPLNASFPLLTILHSLCCCIDRCEAIASVAQQLQLIDVKVAADAKAASCLIRERYYIGVQAQQPAQQLLEAAKAWTDRQLVELNSYGIDSFKQNEIILDPCLLDAIQQQLDKPRDTHNYYPPGDQTVVNLLVHTVHALAELVNGLTHSPSMSEQAGLLNNLLFVMRKVSATLQDNVWLHFEGLLILKNDNFLPVLQSVLYDLIVNMVKLVYAIQKQASSDICFQLLFTMIGIKAAVLIPDKHEVRKLRHNPLNYIDQYWRTSTQAKTRNRLQCLKLLPFYVITSITESLSSFVSGVLNPEDKSNIDQPKSQLPTHQNVLLTHLDIPLVIDKENMKHSTSLQTSFIYIQCKLQGHASGSKVGWIKMNVQGQIGTCGSEITILKQALFTVLSVLCPYSFANTFLSMKHTSAMQQKDKTDKNGHNSHKGYEWFKKKPEFYDKFYRILPEILANVPGKYYSKYHNDKQVKKLLNVIPYTMVVVQVKHLVRDSMNADFTTKQELGSVFHHTQHLMRCAAPNCFLNEDTEKPFFEPTQYKLPKEATRIQDLLMDERGMKLTTLNTFLDKLRFQKHLN